MKAWKAVAFAVFAFIAVALATTTVLGYSAGGQRTNGSYGGYGVAQGSRGDMMHGSMGGWMGQGYSQYSNYTSSNDSSQQSNGGCGMRNGWP